MRKVIFAALLAPIFLFSCGKDDDVVTPTNVTDVCSGSVGTEYFPLNIGDSYTLEYQNSFQMTYNIYGKTTLGATTWAQSKTTTPFGNDTTYMAKFADGSFRSADLDGGELIDTIILIPANPVVGTTWTDNEGTEYEVTSVNASLTTPACTYSGLLEISEKYMGEATPSSKSYYKKGVGLVANQCLANDCMGFDLMYLKSMNLQQ